MRYDDLVARFPFVGLGSVVPLLTVAACSPGSSDAPPQGGSQGDGGGLIGSKQRADHRINRVPDYSIPDVKRAFLQRPPRLPSNGMLRDLVGRS